MRSTAPAPSRTAPVRARIQSPLPTPVKANCGRGDEAGDGAVAVGGLTGEDFVATGVVVVVVVGGTVVVVVLVVVVVVVVGGGDTAAVSISSVPPSVQSIDLVTW
jgi:hypothetical protein